MLGSELKITEEEDKLQMTIPYTIENQPIPIISLNFQDTVEEVEKFLLCK